jgi:hypothetical protein
MYSFLHPKKRQARSQHFINIIHMLCVYGNKTGTQLFCIITLTSSSVLIRQSKETYRRVVLVPVSPSILRASSSICIPSVCARSLRICSISAREYGKVRIIRSLSRRSRGIPCGERMSSVPLQNNNKLQTDTQEQKLYILQQTKCRVAWLTWHFVQMPIFIQPIN